MSERRFSNAAVSAERLVAEAAAAAGSSASPDPAGGREPLLARLRRSRLARRLLALPGVGVAARVAWGMLMAHRTRARLAVVEGNLEELRARAEATFRVHEDSLGDLRRRGQAQADGIASLRDAFADAGARERALREELARLRRLDLLLSDRVSALETLPAPRHHREEPGDMDAVFYNLLEARLRGDRSDILARQTIYLPDIRAAVERTGTRSVLDLGCGRGEWLELLAGEGLEALGVDTNAAQLEEARERGLAVTLGDALDALRGSPDDHYAAVTMFHVAEHLPFPQLWRWLIEVRRVLAPGGVLLLETPNPANLLVSSVGFHTDPTHARPLPAELLELLAASLGFDPVAIRRLHPHARLAEALATYPEELAYMLFGPQDLALVARKPSARV